MRRSSRRFLALGVLVLLFGFGGGVSANEPVVSCPEISPAFNDDFSSSGFYVPSYQGVSLETVTLTLVPAAVGTFTLSLTARSGHYGGTLLGTATVAATFTSTFPVPVVFNFGHVPVTTGSLVTFQGGVVGPSAVYMLSGSDPSCSVAETTGTTAPLDRFRRWGVVTTITGAPPGQYTHSVVVPAVASIHGANGTYYHTDLWAYADFLPLTATLTYYCYLGQNCGAATETFTIAAGTGSSSADIVGSGLNAPETAGALVIRYSSGFHEGTLKVLTRTYTPSLPSPTTGASSPGLAPTAASGRSIFVGLGNNGGDRSAGFRTNAGAFNNFAFPATVYFYLSTANGTSLGYVRQTWAAHEARQINDIFAAVGAGGVVTTDAILMVLSDIPVFSYVTVIDNQSGDSVIQ